MKIRFRADRQTWLLDLGIVEGRRRQFSFPTKREAEASARSYAANVTPLEMLSPIDARRFALAAQKLAAAGATIEQAVDYFLANAEARLATMPLATLLEAAIEEKDKGGARRRYVSQLRCSAMALVRWIHSRHGHLAAHLLTVEMLREWLDGSGWQPKTRSVYLGDVRALLEHGKRLRVLTKNPAAEVPRPALTDDGEIEILPVPRCTRLLVRASRPVRRGFHAGQDFGDLLAYVTLGMFCGIRPAELQRLTWDAIDLEERHVVISGKRAKTRARRVVDLSANAVAWLRQVPEAARSGPVCPRNFRARWEQLRRACGWAIVEGERGLPWPHDALRHSFASYHYAQHRNEALLQTQMGHTSGGVLFRHYRAIATRKQAEAFWGLTPAA